MSIVHKFSDIKLKTTASGAVKILEGVDAINQSIKNILSTTPGERVMQPDFGSRLRDFLFSPMSDFTVRIMETEIERSLSKWEDRIAISNIVVTPYEDENWYEIVVYYRVNETGQQAFFTGKVQPAIKD